MTGNWKYTTVEKNQESLFTIGDNDVMILQADSLFEYHISSVNKHMYGKWSYTDHTLHLKYADPDTIRHFKVDILSDHILKMHEGEVVFNFTRVNTNWGCFKHTSILTNYYESFVKQKTVLIVDWRLF